MVMDASFMHLRLQNRVKCLNPLREVRTDGPGQ